MKDIQSREDIEVLIDKFYEQVIEDDKIGVFFTQVVRLDWEKHIPVMYDFWESTLLGKTKYTGNPMIKHIELSRKKMLKREHFDRWIALWVSTIEENYQGKVAEEAIKRARHIAELMLFKINQQA